MILTTCAACAAPLAHDAPRCVRCHTHARALYEDPDAALDHLREAVTTLEDTTRIARRVLGSAHPLVRSTEFGLRQAFARFKAFGEALKEHAAPAAAG